MTHVVLHMAISIDGRIVTTPWPENVRSLVNDVYERIHAELKGDAWLVGRVTMAEFAQGEPRAEKASGRHARTTWKSSAAGSGPYAVALDSVGKLHLNRDQVNGDALVHVLTEKVSDDYLAELRRDGISYVFAGKDEIDLSLALKQLSAEFGVERLLLEGGGGINGNFLAAGLIDELSVLVVPVADGSDEATLFTSGAPKARELVLQDVAQLEGGIVHLRYQVARTN